VASVAKGQIDLSTLSVTGKAKPAVKGDAPGAVIAAPDLAGQTAVIPRASEKEPLAQRQSADTKAADTKAADAKQADAKPADTKPAAPAVELHGGSVPAPAQKVPGQ
jgi:hypothetical protein